MSTPIRPLRRLHLLNRLAIGASGAAVACVLAAVPAEAQLARMRAMAGTAPTLTAPVVAIPLRPVNAREALARAEATQKRIDTIRGYVSSARDASIAATRAQPADGIADAGLDPIAAVRQAAELRAAGGAANEAQAAQLLVSVRAVNDTTGLNTWEGAGAPVQTVANGNTTVTIDQTQERALLSWNRFDVGAKTTVQFNQKSGGVAQPGWTVVNRVVESVAPSTILGAVKADATVMVLNRNGVIFGAGTQVNLGSLLVSTLELGNYGRNFRDVPQPEGSPINFFEATTLAERNTQYLQTGLFANNSSNPLLPPLILSPLYAPGLNRTDEEPALEGDILIDTGATITANPGGFLLFAGPRVVNAGSLRATEGQVSLQGGRLIAAAQSTGAAAGVDPAVRGLILRTIGTVTSGTLRRSSVATALDSEPDDGLVINTGLIESNRGYLSLGAGVFGSVENAGLLASTTSVSRNGKISLTAGTVTLTGNADASRASGLVILPDAGAETIPQGTATEPPAFKTSEIEIGLRADVATTEGQAGTGASAFGRFLPTVVDFGQNSVLYAPNANVTIGRAAGIAFDPTDVIATLSSITIADGALLDVSGVKNVQLSAARNSLEITPVKRNELRDTPNYREVSLTGDFTLNGSTLFVDPRLSGVRADGVAWIGSPLIEAGSLASQIGVTAAELMTRGGNISLGVNLLTGAVDLADTSRITIAKGAVIDFGGGWVNYAAGFVRTSNLVTADGRIVAIGEADPNDIFVGVAEGFTATQPRFGLTDTFGNVALQGGHFETSYDEGRDAGSLVIGGSAITLDATLHADAFAGARQIAGALQPSLAAKIVQDTRLLQRTTQELPTGGFLRIGSLTGAAGLAPGGDVFVYRGTRGAGDTNGTTLLNDAMLTAAGLGALTIQTTGAVTFSDGSDFLASGLSAEAVTLTGSSAVRLADGGTLTIDAGRRIALSGDITIADGTIAARTYEFFSTPIVADGLAGIGSPFRSDDDIGPLYGVGSALPQPFDITVGGTLSTAGRWVNDFNSGRAALGAAWIDGGTIRLTVAPKVLVALGATVNSAQDAGDLSGSIRIASDALLDVSAGGYVGADRRIDLSGRGGNIALINETTYASTVATVPPATETQGRSDLPVSGSNQSVDFTPTGVFTPAIMPSVRRATVSVAESSLKGFGFTGGGTFTLVAPDIRFGSDSAAGATNLSLDFFRNTGFGTLDATSFRSRFVSDIFTNARTGTSAFLDTTVFTIRDGETLDLTQTLLPAFLDARQTQALLRLDTGSNILATLTPEVPKDAFDRVAANLTLGGLSELDVLAGGRIVGAAGATITAPKLYNDGTIAINGGAIVQRDYLPANLALRGLGVRDAERGGTGLAAVFGTPDEDGQFNELAVNAAGFGRLTNRDLVSSPAGERFIHFLGTLDVSEGIRLTGDSVTDLSGVALYNPRAPFAGGNVGGGQLAFGRVVAGGSITTAQALTPTSNDATRTLFSNPVYGNPRYLDYADNNRPAIVGLTVARTLITERGATIDIGGANGLFDVPVSPTSFARVTQYSDAGTLSLGGGGSIAGATIDAFGGDARATGGVLTWVRPTIVQSDADAPEGEGDGGDENDFVPPIDVVSADQIMAAGFDTLNALSRVTFGGDVSLTLGKAFTLQSAAPRTGSVIAPDAAIAVSAAPETDASVIAPFIRFASRLGSTGGATGTSDAAVSFTASSGIDFVGATLFDQTIGSVTLATPGDIRFIGVDDRGVGSTALPVLNGQVTAVGNLTLDARRVYATTGTGNLQRFIEDARAGVTTTVAPFIVSALGQSTLRFGGTYLNANTAAPLSAGSYLRVLASNIEQAGYLAAPMGLLELGGNPSPTTGTRTLTFEAGSVTTVSGAGLNVPYGTTTDVREYFFSPSVGLPISAPPVGELRLNGGVIDVAEGARIDGRGGGDVFAFEFVSGTGGSRDVLSRFNGDQFSSNGFNTATQTGFQYPDQRQVYAIVPADVARRIADYDPIYSADYTAASNSDIYGSAAGRSVILDAAPGIAAGEYVLLPAHYALLPGAYRVVEQVGASAVGVGGGQTLIDGTLLVGGRYGTAGTGLVESTRHTFAVQPRETILSYSRIETTSANATVVAAATTSGVRPPRLALDAARVVLGPQTALRVAGVFDTTAAVGGRGAQFDLVANNVIVAAEEGTAPTNTLLVTAATLEKLDATSLLIGARRTDNVDGTTSLGIISDTITIGEGVSLTGPELLFAVAGTNSALTISDGASLTATGATGDLSTGDILVPSLPLPPTGNPADFSGVGAVLRLSSGPERLVTRTGDTAARNATRATSLTIGAATLTGATLTLDSSLNFAIADEASLALGSLAISSTALDFGTGFGEAVQAKIAATPRVTLKSPNVVTFAAGKYSFNDLTISAPGIATSEAARGDLTIDAKAFAIRNGGADLGACTVSGALACGSADDVLTINATGASFGSGVFRSYGFAGGVALAATGGSYIDGTGTLDTGAAALSIVTPFLVDRALVADPRAQKVRSDYTLLTTGAVSFIAPPGSTATPTGDTAPGARIAIGSVAAPVASVTIDGALLRATAGIIDIRASGDVTLTGAATLATPGYTRSFGDVADPVIVSASGGTVNVVSLGGDIALGTASVLTVDSGVGSAGTLNLLAGNGAIAFGATLNPGVTGTRDASFAFDAGRSAFDLAAFTTRYGAGFGGAIAIRSGEGDLALNVGQTLRATGVQLVADGGSVVVAGTIDTSGVSVAGLSGEAARTARVDGGDIALYARDNVTLAGTALLDTRTTGYAAADTRQASAGDVSLGIASETGAITLATGARIDASAVRTQAALAAGDTGNRLVAQLIKDPVSLIDRTAYRLALADTGGKVSLRAPVIGAGDQIDIRMGGTIVGAADVTVEGYRRYDLDAIVESGLYTGVRATDGGVAIDLGAAGNNILASDFVGADGTPSVVNFVRGFTVRTVDGSSLGSARLRPGVELVAAGGIDFDSNWNLAAGSVDEQAAAEAGLLQLLPQLGTRTDGSSYYAVVPGREAELLQNYVTMSYRVGGSATGEAPVVSLRAGGALTIDHSISDGFFSFGDRTDPRYMSYQLGGGNRTVQPAVSFGCGAGASSNCTPVASFDDIVSGRVRQSVANVATISLAAPVAGSDLAPGILAPYSALANSAAAIGSGTGGVGDPLGSSEIFPLLDGGLTAVRSSDIRLVGGADAVLSADPLHVDRATGAAVSVTGEHSYTVVATPGTSRYGGEFQIRSRSTSAAPIVATPEDFIATVANAQFGGGLSEEDAGDYFTLLNWGDGTVQATQSRAAARAYFRDNFPRAVFQGSSTAPTGVAAPLSAILGFLASYGDDYATRVNTGVYAAPAPIAPAPISLGTGSTAYVNTVVRTGDGAIALAAAGSVDLRRTEATVYRTPINTTTPTPPALGFSAVQYQIGGSAIYTAGHLAEQRAILADTIDGTVTQRFDWNATPAGPAIDPLRYEPSSKGLFLQTPKVLVDGGDISVLAAGGDILARRDAWGEKNLGEGTRYIQSFDRFTTYLPSGLVGGESQRWMVGQIGADSQILIAPQLFTAGIGALGGGDVSVTTAGSVRDLTVALNASVTTVSPLLPTDLTPAPILTGVDVASGAAALPTLVTLGRGNASIAAAGDLIGGQFDVASGSARVTVGRDVVTAGYTARPEGNILNPLPQGDISNLRLRVADSTIALDAIGSVLLGGIGAFGVTSDASVQDARLGFFSARAGVDVSANSLLTLGATRPELAVNFFSGSPSVSDRGYVLPPSLGLTSLGDSIQFATDVPLFLFPSAVGQLDLYSGGDIASVALIMSDADPSLLPGAFSVRRAVGGSGGAGLDFGFDPVFPSTSQTTLRVQHNNNITHAGDPEPVRIYAGGSITNTILSLPKQARIGAGLDIVDIIFTGQNVAASDVTRITAGRDITGTTGFSTSLRLPFINGNSFVLGGPGTLAVEAGRNIGPFANSATVTRSESPGTFAGGIRTVGNDLNPWLGSAGASIDVLYGIANGADFDALQAAYLDPANAADLDGDLFVQVSDDAGNLSPDRTRPIYAPILARWLRDRAPDAFAAVFGTATPTDAQLATEAYARFPELYAAFTSLGALNRRTFLTNEVYFNELSQTSIPTSPSFEQFVRGYRATQTLFSPEAGYTDNLATYTTDPSTVSPDHPLGQPTKNVVDGEPEVATRVRTGDIDLRLATIQSVRGGDVTILGPGGDLIAGSVVRTSEQAARRATIFGFSGNNNSIEQGELGRPNQTFIDAIPIGFEGVLTLRGGTIRSFSDGDFRLNQSRVFTQAGGDIVLWSSNGDLNAGQGPKSASNFPPVTVRFDLNGSNEVDSAGSVSGAGIGAFRRSPTDPLANILLIAPVGEVDAGDAGVRASGNVFVAAARVANADNFSAGGSISGVPTAAVTAAPALPANAASAIAGQVAGLNNNAANADRPSLISVDVLGYIGQRDPCEDPNSTDPSCRPGN